MHRSRTWLGDAALALAMLGVALLLFIGAADLPASKYEPMGPAGLPIIVAIALASLSAILLILALVRGRRTAPRVERKQRGHVKRHRMLGIAALTVGYIAVLDHELVGFPVATTAFLFGAGALMIDLTVRRVTVLVGVALVVGIGSSLILTRILTVTLPGS